MEQRRSNRNKLKNINLDTLTLRLKELKKLP